MPWVTINGHHVLLGGKGGVSTPTNQRTESLPKGMQTGGHPDNGASTAKVQHTAEAATAHQSNYRNFSESGNDMGVSAISSALRKQEVLIGGHNLEEYSPEQRARLSSKIDFGEIRHEPARLGRFGTTQAITNHDYTGGANHSAVHTALTAAGFSHVGHAPTSGTTAVNYYEKGGHQGVAVRVEQGRADRGYLYDAARSSMARKK